MPSSHFQRILVGVVEDHSSRPKVFTFRLIPHCETVYLSNEMKYLPGVGFCISTVFICLCFSFPSFANFITEETKEWKSKSSSRLTNRWCMLFFFHLLRIPLKISSSVMKNIVTSAKDKYRSDVFITRDEKIWYSREKS